MEKLKKNYFDQRINSLEKENFRSILASREIETYKILENISDHYRSVDIEHDGFISKINNIGIKIIEAR